MMFQEFLTISNRSSIRKVFILDITRYLEKKTKTHVRGSGQNKFRGRSTFTPVIQNIVNDPISR